MRVPARGRAAAAVWAALALACASPAPPEAGTGTAAAGAGPAETAAATAAGTTTATVYYGSDDGVWLVPVERLVPIGDGVLGQGRELLRAALAEPPEGLLPVLPEGTGLRGFYVTDRGEAFVDLSAEAAAFHPGGTLAEELSVYAVVNAVTTNIPDIERVQILIAGREVDSLAGHLDLRRPLEPDLSLVRGGTN